MATSQFPIQLDAFKRLQDYPASQAANVARYKALKEKTSLTSAEQAELSNLKVTLNSYLYEAEDINLQVDAIEKTQKFVKDSIDGYMTEKQDETHLFVEAKKGEVNSFTNTKITEVTDYVDDKKNEMDSYAEGKKVEITNYADDTLTIFDNEIAKFTYAGIYSEAKSYYVKNWVVYNDGTGDQTFIAIQDVPVGVKPTNTAYWRKLSIKGEKGNDGIGLVFKGEWNSSTSYSDGDAVHFGGILFGSLQANQGQQPNLLQDTEYWAKAWSLAVVSSQTIGTRNITTTTSNVNFITGEISAFNRATDSLEVYQNSTRLTRGVDYTLNANNVSIDKIGGSWEGSVDKPVFFEFVIIRNQKNDLVFNDGQTIQDGTITINKLNQAVQDNINAVPAIDGKIDDLAGIGRTTETVKKNADDIATVNDNIDDLAGEGRTTENVKQNADDIATINDNINSLSGEGRTTENVKQNADDIIILDGKIDTSLASAKDYADTQVATVNQSINNHTADYIKHPAVGGTGGTSTAYTFNPTPALTSLVAGVGAIITVHLSSGDNPTLNISSKGAKSILKPNGSSAKFIKDGVYHVRYNGVNFILLGEGGEYGTALPSDVKQGKTIGTEDGIKEGSMPVRGAINHILRKQNEKKTLLSGYYDESTVTANITNLLPQYIKKGVNVGDVIGTLVGARQYAVPSYTMREEEYFSSSPVNSYRSKKARFFIGGSARFRFWIFAYFVSGYGGTITGDYIITVNGITKKQATINQYFDGSGDNPPVYSGSTDTRNEDISFQANDVIEAKIRWTGDTNRITSARVYIGFGYDCAADVLVEDDFVML